MKIHLVEQGTERWHRLRLGKPTASNFGRIVKVGKSGHIEERDSTEYLWKLVAERLAGEPMNDGFASKWMKRGIEREADARAAFAKTYRKDVQQVGFITTDDGRIGCSPDGVVDGGRELVEIKVPAPWTHLRYLCEGFGEDYLFQVMGQMWICNASMVHFLSWHEYWPHYRTIVYRNEAFMGLLAAFVYKFCDRVDEMEQICRQKGCRLPNELEEMINAG